MDAQQIVDMLLSSGQALVEKGKTLAEAQLNLPQDEQTRQAMLNGAEKGAMAAGALALLLGTSIGRKLTGAGIKLGGLAAVGTVAYDAFQKWQSQQGTTIDVGQATAQLTGPAGDSRSKALLLAMIAAAKVDGQVDEREKTAIAQHIKQLNLGDLSVLFAQALEQPIDAKTVAASVDSPTAAAEIYLVSRAMLNLNNEAERSYLAQLVTELKLAPDLVAQLENQVQA